MDQSKFKEAMERFIHQRINDAGASESAALSEAAEEMREKEMRLTDTFSDEQKRLWTVYELARGLHEGETLNFY